MAFIFKRINHKRINYREAHLLPREKFKDVTNKLNIQIDFLNVKKIKIVDTFMQAFFELVSI